MTPQTNSQSLTAPLVAKRAIYTLKFKESDQPCFDGRRVETAGIIELTLSEEQVAGKLAPSGQILYEMLKASIIRINGQPVGSADGSIDTWFAQLRPRQRDLLLQAYKKYNTITEKDGADFLETVEVKIE